jgi:hypothetical protein
MPMEASRSAVKTKRSEHRLIVRLDGAAIGIGLFGHNLPGVI